MGAYRSRPAASLQDVWREDCTRSQHQIYRWLNEICNTELDTSGEGWTELHMAIYNSEYQNIDLKTFSFVTAINAATKDLKLTPLHLCAIKPPTSENIATARVLLDANADVSATTKNGFSALDLAAATWNVDMIKLLTDKYPTRESSSGALARYRGDIVASCYGITPLHAAILRACADEDDALPAIQQLLNSLRASIDAADDNGFTALHFAAMAGHTNIAMALLHAGANASATTQALETPLHLAVVSGRFRMSSVLIQRADVNVNAVDLEGNTPAHYSCGRGDLQILELLMSSPKFSSITTTNMYRNTPIHAACYQGRVEVINFLLGTMRECESISVPEDLLLENVFSESALHAAASNGQSPLLLRTLLQAGKVPVNIQGRDGHTPLHSACWNGNVEAARLLLECGGDIRIKTHTDQQTCVNWCHQKGYDEMLFMLHQHAEMLVQDLMHVGDDGSKNDDRPEAWEDLLAEITGLPKPSPMGKIRSITRQRADVAQLRNLLPASLQLSSANMKVIDQIAAGSFAKVYRVMLGDRIVAAKKYKEGHFHRKTNIDLFCREVSIHSKLRHPNVLQFLGAVVNETPSRFCILTEYIDGGSLYDLLHVKKQTLEYKVRITTAGAIAAAMSYLHGLQVPVIHRDLNSHNVLLTSDFNPVVADFGESRVFSDSKTLSDAPKNLTMQPGNLRWMAPEIFRQNSTYTLKADVYSYGLVVWEIMTGQVPFGDFEPAAAAAQMAYHQQRPTIPDSCPKAVAGVISACWRATHRNRPSFLEIEAWLKHKHTKLIDEDRGPISSSMIKKLESIFSNSESSDAMSQETKRSGYVKSVQVAVPPWMHDGQRSSTSV